MLHVYIPASMSEEEEENWVVEMLRRIERKADARKVNLKQRAHALARRYGLPTPLSIGWSSRQNTCWGSCTPMNRAVRISTAIAGFPKWVVDYVIVHELAHLVEGGHGEAFWEVVSRYPLAERARGFLIAKGMEEAEAPAREPRPEPRLVESPQLRLLYC